MALGGPVRPGWPCWGGSPRPRRQAAGHAPPSWSHGPAGGRAQRGGKGPGRGRPGSHTPGAGARPRGWGHSGVSKEGRRRRDAGGQCRPFPQGRRPRGEAAPQRGRVAPTGACLGARGRPSVCSPRSLRLPDPARLWAPGGGKPLHPEAGAGCETKAGRGFRTGSPVCSRARWPPKFWAAVAKEVSLAADDRTSGETRGRNAPSRGAGACLCPAGPSAR